MTSELDRPPTKAEQYTGAALSFVLLAIFGGVAGLLWAASGLHMPVAAIACVLTALFIGSVFMFYRALGTAPKSLTRRQSTVVSWFLVFVGLVCASFSLLPGAPLQTIVMVLGAGVGLVCYGVSGIIKPRGRKI